MSHILFFLVISTLWFIPGIVLRRIMEKRIMAEKEDAQAKAIARLYPKKK